MLLHRYDTVIGGGNCAVVDTFWQTETGGHVVTPMPAAHTVKPGAACYPFFGIDLAVRPGKGVLLWGAKGGEQEGGARGGGAPR